MEIQILYDSYFGNTREIAEVIGQTLFGAKVEVLDIKTLDPNHFSTPDLLIVGSPTRGFRPSPATQEFFKTLPGDKLKGIMVAAFDTRMALRSIKSGVLRFIVKTGGYAAKTIEKSMKKKGGESIIEPEGFCVTDKEGPLLEGEKKRAEAWAKKI
ncbi:flavodoxin domain-containing protein [Catalinimonas sp. 4WD22]|uniref:flavodoxin family protein n=1 Tax=Catalinimonas locisalis TaxID=3133978 RepID=UPI003100D50E